MHHFTPMTSCHRRLTGKVTGEIPNPKPQPEEREVWPHRTRTTIRPWLPSIYVVALVGGRRLNAADDEDIHWRTGGFELEPHLFECRQCFKASLRLDIA